MQIVEGFLGRNAVWEEFCADVLEKAGLEKLEAVFKGEVWKGIEGLLPVRTAVSELSCKQGRV